MNRRTFMQLGGYAAGAALLTKSVRVAAQHAGHGAHASSVEGPELKLPAPTSAERGRAVAPNQPAVITPNGKTLSWKMVDGVKVGHLVAQAVQHEFAPGLNAECWGYNGGTPGPTIEAVEGDRVRIYVTNKLPEPTTVHWHGVIVPNGMDGVAGLNQPPIPVGDTFVYEFTLKHPGTFMYHSHFDEMTQIALGMLGMFIVHPRRAMGPAVDRDFVLMTHEWRLDVGAKRPNPTEMTDWNLFTFNSKAFPATQPLLMKTGERIRIRLGNLGPMDHHPIHLHGLSFVVTGTDGGFVPKSAQYPESTVLVPVGTTRVIEFTPTEPGDWAMHCHMTHHTMTQMGHGVPNLIGANTEQLDRRMTKVLPSYMTMGKTGMGDMGEMKMPVPPNSLPMRSTPGPFGGIDMGGMFTVLKVRDDPRAEDALGWYEYPQGSISHRADAASLAADGIDVT
ncbi:MAG TPA: multicopper oxidase domain-containing protein [Polyangiales bacterium]|nr:multicopper oxidase domain-containing protein [Polyangiales bacterium]